jgi:hypothetical protein
LEPLKTTCLLPVKADLTPCSGQITSPEAVAKSANSRVRSSTRMVIILFL